MPQENKVQPRPSTNPLLLHSARDKSLAAGARVFLTKLWGIHTNVGPRLHVCIQIRTSSMALDHFPNTFDQQKHDMEQIHTKHAKHRTNVTNKTHLPVECHGFLCINLEIVSLCHYDTTLLERLKKSENDPLLRSKCHEHECLQTDHIRQLSNRSNGSL